MVSSFGNTKGGFSVRPRMRIKFDRRIISRNWRNINFTPMQKAGLMVRRKMKDLIRKDTTKSQKPSKAGKPPKSRATGHPFRIIRSAVIDLGSGVVIGHESIHGLTQTPMQMHEFGEKVVIRQPAARRQRARSRAQAREARRKFLEGTIQTKPQRFVKKTIKMPKRPFARPALEKTLPKIPKLWLNSVSSVRSA